MWKIVERSMLWSRIPESWIQSQIHVHRCMSVVLSPLLFFVLFCFVLPHSSQVKFYANVVSGCLPPHLDPPPPVIGV